MEQVGYVVPGAVASYSAKSALFSAAEADRGTFFDCTGSFTITLTTSGMSAGWSAWFRNVSGSQVFDPSGATLINGAATYTVANAGDVILVEYTGSAYVISHSQRPSTVAITGGTINGTALGGTTPAAGAFTTVSATGVITSTLVTGTAPFTVASTTVVANLNASLLLGLTWGAPGLIGSVTPATGAFTTLSATGVITSTLVTGTAPFTIASTTQVANLNVSQLVGATWLIPGSIGGTTPNAGAFTTLTSNGATTFTLTTDSSSISTGGVVMSGGLGVAKKLFFGGTLSSAVNSGSTINGDFSDTAASRTTPIVRVNSSATAHTSTGLLDIVSSASTNADIMLRLRANGVNTVLTYADGSATINGIWTFANTTDASSTTTGGLLASGGLGVAKKLYVGTDVFVNSATFHNSLQAMTNGAGALTGTLLNSPVTGNPTKWVPVSDNGTTRYCPLW